MFTLTDEERIALYGPGYDPHYWDKNGIVKPRPIIVCAVEVVEFDGQLHVLIGARHFDHQMRRQIDMLNINGFKKRASGFMDQFGEIYSRTEAREICISNNHIPRNGYYIHDKHLFSEDLY